MATKNARQTTSAKFGPAESRSKGKTDKSKADTALLRAFAAAIQALGPADEPTSALEEAQELMFDAWEAPTKGRRIALAKRALEISPLCADAYSLLAGYERSGSDAELELWRRGVAAGEDGLGPAGMEEHAGEFWSFHETRPYMRARAGLAKCLWARGDLLAAAAEYRAMLQLNPNDNLGVRYALMSVLSALREEAELSALLKRYPEDSAFWTYTDALAAFRREGSTKASAKSRKRALSSNHHVADYLLGKRKLPRRLPDFYSTGDDSEAALYLDDNADLWTGTEGALIWLAEQPAQPASIKRRPGLRIKT